MKSGQTLVLLLVFVAITITITSAAVAIMIVNSQGGNRFELREQAYAVAESGAENALLRLLRDPNYTGETLTIGDSTTTITVTGSTTKTIVSQAVSGNFSRAVQVTVNFTNNILTITSWQEVF